jgi:dihydroflavonol-4-reductase
MNLITGATGHIGNVLVRELVKRGEKVRIFVLPNEDLSSISDLRIEIFRGNILDKESIAPAMRGVETVFHLAGIISIMPGRNQLVHDVNVIGTMNMVDCAKAVGVKKFIHTSSIHAFIRVKHGIVIDETIPIDPECTIAEYDKSKAEATLAVLAEVKNGFPAVVVCPTGVIGPFDFKESEMGVLIQEWMSQKLNFLIEGEYDFVDVRDVVSGMILARNKGIPGQVYILSGELIKVSDIWKLVKELVTFSSKAINIPLFLAKFIAQITQVFYQLTKTKPRFTTYSIDTLQTNAVISSAKARSFLGYKPRALRESIRDTVNWWKQKGLKTIKKLRPD